MVPPGANSSEVRGLSFRTILMMSDIIAICCGSSSKGVKDGGGD